MGEKNRFRKKQLLIRLCDEEWEIFEYKAGLSGKSKSDFVRDLILLSEVKVVNPILTDKNFQKMLYEINRIGNNINQIAYNANLKKSTGKEEIEELREQYSVLLSLYEDTFLYPESENEKSDWVETE